jgi:hypothetical protein
MKWVILRTTLFSWCLIWFCGQQLSHTQIKQFKIDGQALDLSNNGLPSVFVSIYRGNELVNSGWTNKDGFYSVSFAGGERISLVRYDLTNWYPGIVEDISGLRNHFINKVLIETSASLSPGERNSKRSHLSMLRELDESNGISEHQFNERYSQVLMALAHTSPQPSPKLPTTAWMGAWRLSEAKSKLAAGLTSNNTVVYEAAGDRVKVIVDGVDIAGTPIHSEWTGKFDGRFYPVTGDPTSDMRSYRKIDNHTLTFTATKDGKVTLTGRIVVSANGRTRTVTTTGTNSKGKKVSNRAVYDKQ